MVIPKSQKNLDWKEGGQYSSHDTFVSKANLFFVYKFIKYLPILIPGFSHFAALWLVWLVPSLQSTQNLRLWSVLILGYLVAWSHIIIVSNEFNYLKNHILLSCFLKIIFYKIGISVSAFKFRSGRHWTFECRVSQIMCMIYTFQCVVYPDKSSWI